MILFCLPAGGFYLAIKSIPPALRLVLRNEAKDG